MPTETLKTFGERIKFIRKKINYSQIDLAKVLKLKSAAAISKWESNAREPEIKYISQLAELGRVSIDWLISGKEDSSIYVGRIDNLEKENNKLKEKLAVYEKTIGYLNEIKDNK